MKNSESDYSGLLYKNFSLIFIQSFEIGELKSQHLQPVKNPYAEQIFSHRLKLEDRVSFFKMPSFSINIEGEDYTLKGLVNVNLSIYQNKIAALSFRLMISSEEAVYPNQCLASKVIDSDDLIHLMSLGGFNEHWNVVDGVSKISDEKLNVTLSPNEIIENEIKGGTDAIRKVFDEYKDSFCCDKYPIDSYVVADIWEDVACSDDSFSSLSPEGIIDKIIRKHRNELIGLLSLYPYEWKYRSEQSFDEVCGSNVAIDTDDLILLNDTCCVIFGTYGLRGNDHPTNWQEHLSERELCHMSWPEFYHLLEFILVRKYYLSNLICDINNSISKVDFKKSTENIIRINSEKIINTIHDYQKLDGIDVSKFVSHKIMFKRSELRMQIYDLEKKLDRMYNYSMQLLRSLNDLRELKHSRRLNSILGIFTLAALFEIIFAQIEIPFLNYMFGDNSISKVAALFIIGMTCAFILLGFGFFFVRLFQRIVRK